jgi:hypothetical protein
MWALPNVAPDLFPRQSIDGSSARALWVQSMALVHLAVGLGFLVQLEIWPRVMRWLTTEPAMEPVWTRDPVPANAVALDMGAAEVALSEQSALFAAGRFEPDSVVALRGKYATLWSALKVAFLDEKRFVHFLERFRFLSHRHRDGAHAHRPAPVVFGQDAEHALVHLIQSRGINLQQLERRSRNWLGNVTSRAFLREVADEVDQVVSNARGAA